MRIQWTVYLGIFTCFDRPRDFCQTMARAVIQCLLIMLSHGNPAVHIQKVCMHACMHVRMYLCIYVSMYVCMYVCMYVLRYVCMYVLRYVCMHACMHAGRYVRMVG